MTNRLLDAARIGTDEDCELEPTALGACQGGAKDTRQSGTKDTRQSSAHRSDKGAISGIPEKSEGSRLENDKGEG